MWGRQGERNERARCSTPARTAARAARRAAQGCTNNHAARPATTARPATHCLLRLGAADGVQPHAGRQDTHHSAAQHIHSTQPQARARVPPAATHRPLRLGAADDVLPDVAQFLDAHRLDEEVARAVRDAAHYGRVLAVGRHHWCGVRRAADGGGGGARRGRERPRRGRRVRVLLLRCCSCGRCCYAACSCCHRCGPCLCLCCRCCSFACCGPCGFPC